MADLMAEISEEMQARRRESEQRRVVFDRMLELEGRWPLFRFLPSRLMALLTRLSLQLRPPEVSHG